MLSLDGVAIALRLCEVERLIRAVAVTPVADAPKGIIGLINLHGTVVPILDLRELFGVPQRDISPTDQFVIAGVGEKRVGILVDGVTGVTELVESDTVTAADILPGLGKFIAGAVKLENGLILIYNLERFLTENGDYLFD